MINSLGHITQCLKSLRASSRVSNPSSIPSSRVQAQPTRYLRRATAWENARTDHQAKRGSVSLVAPDLAGNPASSKNLHHNLRTSSSSIKRSGDDILWVNETDYVQLVQEKLWTRLKRRKQLAYRKTSRLGLVTGRCKPRRGFIEERPGRYRRTSLARSGWTKWFLRSDVDWLDESPIPLPPKYGPSRRIRSLDGSGWSYFHVGIIRKIQRANGPKRKVDRPKIISLRPLKNLTGKRRGKNGFDKVSNSWLIRYAVIADRTHSLDLWPSRKMKRELLRTIGLNMSRKAIVLRWLSLQSRLRLKTWQRFMLLALQCSPERAFRALDIAISQSVPRVPRYMLEDCLNHLAAVYLEGVENPSRSSVDMTHRLVCDLAKKSRLKDGQTSSIPQRAVYLVLSHCNNDQAEILYKVLRKERIFIYPMTLLHFLSKFIDMGNTSLSLQVLQDVSSTGFNMSIDSVQSGCVKLIRARIGLEDVNSSPKDLYKMQTYILAQMVHMGIRPGIKLYNAIILNAVDAYEYGSALRFYESAVETGLKPDATTYGILLKAANQSLDYGILNMVFRDAEADGTLHLDSRLICDLLYVTLKLEESTSQPFLFDRLLQIYRKYCHPGLLKELGLCEMGFNASESPNHSVISPSSRIIALMIMAYIKQYRYSDRLAQLYHQYRSYVEQGHPKITATAETDHVANAFIMAFGRRPQTLNIATSVVRDMLKTESGLKPTTSQQLKIATPTVQTWSILLLAYIRNNQARAAEKILTMMRERHIEPNQVTWNSLTSGYSAMQDIHKAVDVVKRMEAESFEMDSYTLKALGRFRNRTRLLKVLKETLKDELEADDEGCGEGLNDPKQAVEASV